MQALHHAAVLNDSIAQPGVAGSFGWCMTDYNTHREFGSGDRICYHGVMDLFRNPKLSAAVYASQKTPRAPSDIVLEVSSAMTLGDLPGGAAAACWVFTNAESVRLYRGNDFVAEFGPDRRGRFAALPHPPIEINDFVGSLLEKYEGMDHATGAQVAAILNELRRDAMALSPLSKARMLSLRLSWNELLRMYYKYIGVLGSSAPVYRFEAVWHGRAVRTVVREPVQSVRLECTVHNPLRRGRSAQRGRPGEDPGPGHRPPAGRHGGHLPCHHRRGRTRRAALPHGGRAGHRSSAHCAQPGRVDSLKVRPFMIDLQSVQNFIMVG